MNAFITVFYDWSRIVTAPLAWAGPLLVRLVVGWVFLWTGWQKLQILPRMVENFRSWGIPAPEIMTPFVSGLEFVGGLLLPAGARGPAFLVLDNFRAILKYNNSTAYGLAIGLLSGALDSQPGVQAAWPRSDHQLGRSERIELQELLASRGYTPGAADGIIGANTRKAIRSAQQAQGWPADGYPTHKLLESLRKR